MLLKHINRSKHTEASILIQCFVTETSKLRREISLKKDIRRSDRRHYMILLPLEFFKKMRRKKLADVYTLLCLQSAELS